MSGARPSRNMALPPTFDGASDNLGGDAKVSPPFFFPGEWGAMRDIVTVVLILASLSLASCASKPEDPEAQAEAEATNDPLEPANRAVFGMNMYLDRNVFGPVAEGYRDVAPDWLRQKVHNIISNLQEPYVAGNDLLQGNPDAAADSLGRFVVNSTFGLLGANDALAESGGPEGHTTDLGATMGVWGIDEGPYLMLPILGPSSLRDGTGRAAEIWANPSSAAFAAGGLGAVNAARFGVGALDTRTSRIDTLNEIHRTSLDEYATIRSLYRQTRSATVTAGKLGPRRPEGGAVGSPAPYRTGDGHGDEAGKGDAAKGSAVEFVEPKP